MDQPEIDKYLAILGHHLAEVAEDGAHQRVPIANTSGRVVTLAAIRRGREHERRALAVHHARDDSGIGAIAAEQPMMTELPEIARSAYGLAQGLRRFVGIVVTLSRRGVLVVEGRHQPIELDLVEASQRQVEAFAV